MAKAKAKVDPPGNQMEVALPLHPPPSRVVRLHASEKEKTCWTAPVDATKKKKKKREETEVEKEVVPPPPQRARWLPLSLSSWQKKEEEEKDEWALRSRRSAMR